MKSLLVILALITAAQSSFASTAVKATKAKQANDSKIGTDHNFDDKVVSGKFQYPDEATATVDDEKLMDDLIGVRKNFKDRLKESAERR
jgi:hypothetical protein